MTIDEQAAYSAAFHVARIPRSCGTCKYFHRLYEECGCTNQKQAEFDSLEQRRRASGLGKEEFGAFACGVCIDEGYVCDLWEQDNGEQAERLREEVRCQP